MNLHHGSNASTHPYRNISGSAEEETGPFIKSSDGGTNRLDDSIATREKGQFQSSILISTCGIKRLMTCTKPCSLAPNYVLK